eukprot:12494830-Alexandrium_andersonii.AAC.1
MCNSTSPHVPQAGAAHAEPPVLTLAMGTVARNPPDKLAKLSFPEAFVRRSPWPPSGQGGSACAAVSSVAWLKTLAVWPPGREL